MSNLSRSDELCPYLDIVRASLQIAIQLYPSAYIEIAMEGGRIAVGRPLYLLSNEVFLLGDTSGFITDYLNISKIIAIKGPTTVYPSKETLAELLASSGLTKESEECFEAAMRQVLNQFIGTGIPLQVFSGGIQVAEGEVIVTVPGIAIMADQVRREVFVVFTCYIEEIKL